MKHIIIKFTLLVSLFIMMFGIASAYNPQGAYNYAQKYATTVTSDGYFWNTPSGYIQISPGTNMVGRIGYDCAHFVSSAIGNEQHEIGGGLTVPSRVPPTYGEPSATNLGNWLISNNLGIEVSDVLQLEKGDVIVYDWEKDGQWDHITLYLGGGLIASHTSFLWNSDWKMGDLDANHRFIHIKGNPTNEWEFNTPGIKEGWYVHNIISWSVENDGMFRIDPNINDPYIESPSISVSANNFNTIDIRMSSNAPDTNGAIYFKTSTSPEYSDDKKVVFSVTTGPNWYEYHILMTQNPLWTGTITGIRVDPSNTGRIDNSDAVGFDYIRLKYVSPCTNSISPLSNSFGNTGGSGSVSVTSSSSSCAWTATSNVGWITITSGSSGSGSGSVGYSVTANTGTTSRTGTATIAGKTFTVTQTGLIDIIGDLNGDGKVDMDEIFIAIDAFASGTVDMDYIFAAIDAFAATA